MPKRIAIARSAVPEAIAEHLSSKELYNLSSEVKGKLKGCDVPLEVGYQLCYPTIRHFESNCKVTAIVIEIEIEHGWFTHILHQENFM